MAKISIAMTTYNGEKFVEKQLLSLLNQTRKADEVIIRDDCSTDRTAEIVTDFIQKNSLENWNFSINKYNLGYKSNFYEAISQTTGDIIFLCDQDDIWKSEKLQLMEKVFAENKQIRSLNTTFEFIDNSNNVFTISAKRNYINNNLIRSKKCNKTLVLTKFELLDICNFNITPGCCMAFTNEVKQIYLNKSNSVLIHDWEINFISATLNGLYFYNVPLTQYRIHDNNSVGLREIIEKKDLRLIGLRSRLNKAKMICEHYKTFAMYIDLLNVADRKEFLKQREFVDKRRSVLESNSVIQLISLYKYYKYYRRSITWQGRVSDFICAIKKVSD